MQVQASSRCTARFPHYNDTMCRVVVHILQVQASSRCPTRFPHNHGTGCRAVVHIFQVRASHGWTERKLFALSAEHCRKPARLARGSDFMPRLRPQRRAPVAVHGWTKRELFALSAEHCRKPARLARGSHFMHHLRPQRRAPVAVRGWTERELFARPRSTVENQRALRVALTSCTTYAHSAVRL